MSVKSDILAIIKEINNGYDFLKSDYASSEAQEQEYENEKQAQLETVADKIETYLEKQLEDQQWHRTIGDL